MMDKIEKYNLEILNSFNFFGLNKSCECVEITLFVKDGKIYATNRNCAKKDNWVREVSGFDKDFDDKFSHILFTNGESYEIDNDDGEVLSTIYSCYKCNKSRELLVSKNNENPFEKSDLMRDESFGDFFFIGGTDENKTYCFYYKERFQNFKLPKWRKEYKN